MEEECDIREDEKGRDHQYKNISDRESSVPTPTDPLTNLEHITAHTKHNLAESAKVHIDTSRTIRDFNRFNYTSLPKTPTTVTDCTVQEVTETTEQDTANITSEAEQDEETCYMHREHRIRPTQRVNFETKNNHEKRPGWVDRSTTSFIRRPIDWIYFDCYGVGHFSSDDACDFRLNISGFHLAVRNYEALSPELQHTIPDHNYEVSKMAIERSWTKHTSAPVPDAKN